MQLKFLSPKRNLRVGGLLATAGLAGLIASYLLKDNNVHIQDAPQGQENGIEELMIGTAGPSYVERGIENIAEDKDGKLEISFSEDYLKRHWKAHYMRDGILSKDELSYMANLLYWRNAFEFSRGYGSPILVPRPEDYKVFKIDLDGDPGKYKACIFCERTNKRFSLTLERDWSKATLKEY